MRNGTDVLDRLGLEVQMAPEEARALCAIDPAAALRLLVAADRRLLGALRADGLRDAMRERLIAVAARYVGRMPDRTGWPVFSGAGTMRAHLALRLAAAGGQLEAAVFDRTAPAPVDPEGLWRQLASWLVETANPAAAENRPREGLAETAFFQARIVESDLGAGGRLRTVGITADGPLVLSVTQRRHSGEQGYRLHVVWAAVGDDVVRLSGAQTRLPELAAAALAADEELYVRSTR